MSWIKVSDRLPEGGANILISNGSKVSEAVFDNVMMEFVDAVEEYFKFKDVTHWQPLPPPPDD